MDPQMRILWQLLLRFRNPPSRRHVWIIAITLAVVVVVALFEWGFGWPAALTVDSGPRIVR